MHLFNAFKVVILDAIHDFHVAVAAGTTHAHAAKINQRVVFRLPREARVPTAAVWLEEHALGVFLHGAGAWPAAKRDAGAVEADDIALGPHLATSTMSKCRA